VDVTECDAICGLVQSEWLSHSRNKEPCSPVPPSLGAIPWYSGFLKIDNLSGIAGVRCSTSPGEWSSVA